MAELPASDLRWWSDICPGLRDEAINLTLERYCDPESQRAQTSRAYEESVATPMFGPHCAWEAWISGTVFFSFRFSSYVDGFRQHVRSLSVDFRQFSRCFFGFLLPVQT